MVVKASIGFLSSHKPADIATQVDIVVDAVTRAKNTFPSPTPALETISTANAALWVAINEAADGSREKRAIRDAKLTEVTSLMRQLAAYVTSTSNGDMAKLLSSGFPIQKPTRTPIGELPTPGTPKAAQGQLTGQMVVSTPPVYGASSYNWRVALASAPETYVKTAQTTASRTSFASLTAGEIYNVEVNAVGSAGVSNWSTAGQLRVI